MDYKIPELKSEEDIVELIGLNTAMKFKYMSEGIIQFQTVVRNCYDNMDLFTYVVDFYIGEGNAQEFCNYDSFGQFLSNYRIHSVTIDYDGVLKNDNIYLYYQE